MGGSGYHGDGAISANHLIPPVLYSLQALARTIGASLVPSSEPVVVYAPTWTRVNEAFWLLRGQAGTVEPILYCAVISEADFMLAPYSRLCRLYKSYYRYIRIPVKLEQLVETISGMSRMKSEDRARLHWDLFGEPEGLMNRIRHDLQRVIVHAPLDEFVLTAIRPRLRPLLEEIVCLSKVSDLTEPDAASLASAVLAAWRPADLRQLVAVLKIRL